MSPLRLSSSFARRTDDLRECYTRQRTASTLTEMSDGEVEELNESLHRTETDDKQTRLAGEDSLFADAQTELEGCKEILGALTDWEKEHLADPNMPLRHFRAEKGDVISAIKKIKATIAWREEFGVTKIRDCYSKGGDSELRELVSSESQTGKVYVRGYDKQGRAILYLRPSCDVSKSEVNKMRHLVYNLERAIACTARKSGRDKYNIVIDYSGFKLRNAPPISTAKFTLDILQKHYPERLHRAYLCNPPVVFRTFWAMVKPLVDPVTKEKIVFCHGSTGLKTLEENFDLAVLEKCCGGTKDMRPFDPDEYLSSPFNVTFDEYYQSPKGMIVNARCSDAWPVDSIIKSRTTEVNSLTNSYEELIESLKDSPESPIYNARPTRKSRERCTIDPAKIVVRRSSSFSLMTGSF